MMPQDTETERLLDASIEDFEYLMSNLGRFRKKYGGEFLAVSNKRVVSHHAAIEMVHADLEDRGMDPARLVIQYMPEKDLALIL